MVKQAACYYNLVSAFLSQHSSLSIVRKEKRCTTRFQLTNQFSLLLCLLLMVTILKHPKRLKSGFLIALTQRRFVVRCLALAYSLTLKRTTGL